MRAVVLTGASRGLGAALFDLLYARGDRILALARTFSTAQARTAAGNASRVVLRPADLASAGQVPDEAYLAAFIDRAPEVALIHNAATIEPIGAVGRLAAAQVTTAVGLNLLAPMLLTNAFLAAVGPGSRRVRILFITSGSARRAKPGTAAYCATKAGAEMFFETVAAELSADPRYTLVTVDPGAMDTDMQAVIRETTSYFPDRQRLAERAAAGDLPDPATVARGIMEKHLG